MSGLAALLAGHTPPKVYQWHSAASVEDVRHAVEHAGWTFRYLDGWTVEDRASFVKAATTSLEAPDAGSDDISELGRALDSTSVDGEGLVLLWDGWSPLARRDEQCFDEALEILHRHTASSEDKRVAVVLRGEGPPLDLEELPIRH